MSIQARFEYGITWNGRGITKEAKDFVQGCLQSDPNVRWSAKQALQNLQSAWGPKVDKVRLALEDTSFWLHAIVHILHTHALGQDMGRLAGKDQAEYEARVRTPD